VIKEETNGEECVNFYFKIEVSIRVTRKIRIAPISTLSPSEGFGNCLRIVPFLLNPQNCAIISTHFSSPRPTIDALRSITGPTFSGLISPLFRGQEVGGRQHSRGLAM
jgi:hypothetical protein